MHDTLQENIPVISVMCNPGLRPRHWQHMSDIAKFDLMPDSSTTLRKMMRLNIIPYMEQFEAISASATKVLVHRFHRGRDRDIIYQSLFTNTLVEHAYTKIHKLKNKHEVKKEIYINAISAQCVTK